MVDALLDTATVVDLIRNHPPAVTWITHETRDFGVTQFVWMEIVAGCENKQALQSATKLITRFQLVPIIPQDIDWALTKLTQFNLSHNIDPFDCLIASTSYRLRIPLYTRNMKHFVPLLANLAQKPY